jgi:hypothetical protein
VQVPVQLTNDSSSMSKLSAVEMNYWADPFLKHFVKTRSRRRAPLINRFESTHCNIVGKTNVNARYLPRSVATGVRGTFEKLTHLF